MFDNVPILTKWLFSIQTPLHTNSPMFIHDLNNPGVTSLGLAITCELVRLHGGYIWAESSPGNGATFFIAFRS